MEFSEERLVESQLEEQLHEQNESLDAINEALTSDPTNAELLDIREELVLAIKHAKEGIFDLKRARLLREADSMLGSLGNSTEDVKAEPIRSDDVKPQISDLTDVKPEIIDLTDDKPEPLEGEQWCVGSKCRFQYNDRRWYEGEILSLDSDKCAKIAFLIPTSEKMLMCKFFLQQRCRFGSNCRLSHGIDVPLTSLKPHVPTVWSQSLVGSNIWAAADGKGGVWKKAELETWNDQLQEGQVVFLEDGRSVKLGPEAISLVGNAQVSDNEDESDLEASDSSEYGDENPQGLGFLEGSIAQKGIQTETTKFAKWENHTRGIASKMMASMGYREGMGLGASGQGILDPVAVKVLPPRQSLDHAVANEGTGGKKEKKRSRGGKRKRDKKFAEASRSAKKAQELAPDVFSLINTHLVLHSESSNSGSSAASQQNGKEGRRALVAFSDEVTALKIQIGKLEEMVKRNRKEKAVFEAAQRKLDAARKTLADTEAKHASASDALAGKEKEKRWLKF
uniref:Zinc finger CCCH-type with G patch domain-containing protein n=1 Tax=Kalanchoe fedtschenkoi TaxID=63787 RepID=A0A7N0UTG6_KALFE